MEIGWTDVGSGGYILVSCAHSNTSICATLNLSYLIQSPKDSDLFMVKKPLTDLH